MNNKLWRVHVTIGDGKMKDIPSVNVSSLSNNFCQAMAKNKKFVCSKCYSNRYSTMRPLLEKRLLENTELLSERLLSESELPTFNSRFVRFNSFGELINDIHYLNLIAMAKKNPFTIFGLWTKRHDIVLKYEKQSNIRYVYSVSSINGKKPNDTIVNWFDKIFTAHSKDHKVKINCNKSCMDCLLCYNVNDIKFINERVK